MIKVFNLGRQKKKIISALLAVILLFGSFEISKAMQHYEKTDFVTGLVTASTLNVRSGPSTVYGVVTKVYKNEYVRVFAKIGNWYVIQTDKDYVGAVSKDYIKPIYPNNSNNNNNNSGNTNTTTSLTSDEQETLNLINQERTKNGLKALTVDSEVQKVARIKAQEMVDKNYFSHTSPTYGSPFDMLKSFKISYQAAGENIAGNSSNKAAVTAWMNSQGHRANILNQSFNYTGLGVIKGSKYGKIYVQLFIGR